MVTAISGSYFVGYGTGVQVLNETNAGATAPVGTAAPAEVREQFDLFWEAWGLVKEEFVNPRAMDPRNMTYGAVIGMLDSLGDAHTTFYSPEQSRISDDDIRGSFEGIGVQVETRNRFIMVVAPLPDTPGEKAGLKPGDIIFMVDGVKTEGMTLTEAVNRIRGPRGTTVHLTIVRPPQRDPIEMDIMRAEVVVSSVTSRILEDNIAYVRLTGFTGQTTHAMSQQLQKVMAENPKALVLDLRNNPGGLLETSIEVTSTFLKKGIVLYEQEREGDPKAFMVRRMPFTVDLPMVVLTNRGSASASEIVAGALKDAGRATLVGDRTYGKGSVQNIRQMSDGSTIHLTVAYWLTPNFTDIEGVGIEPNVKVLVTEDDVKNGVDAQLDKAIELIKSGQVAQGAAQ